MILLRKPEHVSCVCIFGSSYAKPEAFFFLFNQRLSIGVIKLGQRYEGYPGSSCNLVIKCSNIDIRLLFSCFEESQVDIMELASHS